MMRAIVRALFRAVGQNYPFNRTVRVFHNDLARWAMQTLPPEMVVKTRNGLMLNVVPSEVIGRQLYLTGTWDPHMLSVLEKLSDGAKTIIDVGANVGFFSLSLAQANPEASVHAIEPQPELAAMLERSLQACGITVALHRFALSDRDGETEFTIDDNNLGASHITTAGAKGRLISVLLRDGNGFLTDLGFEEIDLLKVDVEGHEFKIFRSIEPWLEQQRIRTIVFETRDTPDDERARNILSTHGYRFFSIERGMTKPIIRSCDQYAGQEDLIAVRPVDFDEVRSRLAPWIMAR